MLGFHSWVCVKIECPNKIDTWAWKKDHTLLFAYPHFCWFLPKIPTFWWNPQFCNLNYQFRWWKPYSKIREIISEPYFSWSNPCKLLLQTTKGGHGPWAAASRAPSQGAPRAWGRCRSWSPCAQLAMTTHFFPMAHTQTSGEFTMRNGDFTLK